MVVITSKVCCVIFSNAIIKYDNMILIHYISGPRRYEYNGNGLASAWHQSRWLDSPSLKDDLDAEIHSIIGVHIFSEK